VSTPAPPAFAGAPGNRTIFDAGAGASTGALRFLVADPQGSPVTLTATSSNPAVIPQNRVQLVPPDSLGNASVAVSSIGVYGQSTITLIASDGTLTSTAVFVVTVSPSAVPGPPQGLGAIVTRNRVTFTWQAPASTAAEPVTGYRLEAGTAPGQTIAVILTGDVLSYTVFNAPNGVFFVRLRAQTAAGVSTPSNEVQFATGQAGPPLAPLALLATVQDTSVAMQWTENPQGPIITGYQVRAGSAPGLTDIGVLPLPATARTFTANAPPGTYYVRVVAVNAAGAGVASNEAVLVAQPGTCTIPAVPTGVVASAQPGRLTLRWNAPSSGAIPTTYIVQAGTTSGATDRFAAGLPGTLTSASGIVARGPYFIRMFATNACGASGPSLETSTTIP
jgi:predicted phage tail protein